MQTSSALTSYGIAMGTQIATTRVMNPTAQPTMLQSVPRNPNGSVTLVSSVFTVHGSVTMMRIAWMDLMK